MSEPVERLEDMSPDGRLTLWMQDDGDVVLSITTATSAWGIRGPLPNMLQVEFCTYAGGGRSQHTRKALINLMDAIRKDNQESPQDYRQKS